MREVNTLHDLWLSYNKYANLLSDALGRTSNLVGEYAEYLAQKHYGGKLLPASNASADLEGKNGKCYQIKSRKIKDNKTTTQLSVIRSWDFDYLVVVLFNNDGSVLKVIESPVDVAKEYADENSHQKGSVITTTQAFLSDARQTDLTSEFRVFFPYQNPTFSV